MRSTLFLLPALASAYQLSSFLPSSTRRAAVSMQEAMEATVEPVSAEAEAPMDMAAAVPEKNERFKAISLNALDEWADKFPRLQEKLKDIKLSSLIFPFKASPCAPRLPYLCNQLHARYASRSLLPRPGFVQTWSRS